MVSGLWGFYLIRSERGFDCMLKRRKMVRLYPKKVTDARKYYILWQGTEVLWEPHS